MCDQHSATMVGGLIQGRPMGIDSCIASLIEALNTAGVRTVASCCGHGYRPGNVMLADGREVIIMPDFATARRVDEMFPLTSYGEVR